MEATEILEKARAGGELPNGWVVLPLLRNKVRLGILGWIAGAIVGFGFFAVMLPLMIPHNYLYGFIPALISTLLLGVDETIKIIVRDHKGYHHCEKSKSHNGPSNPSKNTKYYFIAQKRQDNPAIGKFA